MQIDWIQWNSFLKMLSAERTAAYVAELALPFEGKDFPKVMRHARSCLEFVVFQWPSLRGRQPEGRNLVEAWQRYREVAGVLSEAKLLEFAARYDGSLTASLAIYWELQDSVGRPTSKALRDWFLGNFRSSPDPGRQWPWALSLLVGDSDRHPIQATPVPLDKEQRRCAEEFCRRYEAEQDVLEERFFRVSQSAEAAGASPWERVLMNYPPEEGTLKYFPWLDAVRHCLAYRLIRYEWQRFRTELGAIPFEQLTNWVRLNSRLLPFSPDLPDEPKPLQAPLSEGKDKRPSYAPPSVNEKNDDQG